MRRLQALSPQVNKKNLAEYVRGAEPGDIWLKDVTPEIIKGEEGFRFQPCAFWKDVVEWRKREDGGGYVGRHDTIPGDADEEFDEKSGRTVYTRNGNDLIETRSWMTKMNAKRLKSGKVQPTWLSIYLLRTKDKSNQSGTWSTWDINDAGEITTEEEFERGLALSEAFGSGSKKADVEEVSEEGGSGAM